MHALENANQIGGAIVITLNERVPKKTKAAILRTIAEGIEGEMGLRPSFRNLIGHVMVLDSNGKVAHEICGE